MQVPLEIVYRNLDSSAALDSLIRAQMDKLEDLCDHITSSRVALERPHAHPTSGSDWRVRIDMHVPPGHEVVVVHDGGAGDVHEDLYQAVRETFEKARRRLQKLNQVQHGRVKHHPEQQLAGVIRRVFDGYGFLEGVDGREVYFHRNSVVGDEFDTLREGMGVAYLEVAGDDGPQASTVRVVDHRGHDGPVAPSA
jgi:cold shock CspA family protein/ribosome-associated translation inhibitor RaiA